MEVRKGASPHNRNSSTSNIDGKSAISSRQKSSLLFKNKRRKSKNGSVASKDFNRTVLSGQDQEQSTALRSLLDQALDQAKKKVNNIPKSYQRRDTNPTQIQIGRLMSSERDEHFLQNSEIADMPQSPISPVNQSMLDQAFTS